MNRHMFSGLRDFLFLWGSQSVSRLGTAMTGFALIIWVYNREGTASSITLLTVCSLAPSILFSFIAGTLADRWDKKRIMLLTDGMAAAGTIVILALYLTDGLRVWHIYIINVALSFMNAFQGPASNVAVTLLAPKEQYVRVSGLRAFSDAMVTIAAPALGSALLAFGGLRVVLYIDLAAFAVAFMTLLVFIKIPDIADAADEAKTSFVKSCAAGIGFLRKHEALLRIILFFAFINFIAKMGGYGMLPALILSRTGGDQVSLGVVEAAVGIGALAGSVLVTLMKPAKRRTAVVFVTCGMSFFLGEVLWSIGRSLPMWAFAAFACNMPMPFLNANLTAIMRTEVPVAMQGRVFSARDTIQYSLIPPGLLLGGWLADHVFEPLMSSVSSVQRALGMAFGTGRGAGVAVLFFIVGVVGCAASFICLRNPLYKRLDGGGSA